MEEFRLTTKYLKVNKTYEIKFDFDLPLRCKKKLFIKNRETKRFNLFGVFKTENDAIEELTEIKKQYQSYKRGNQL